MTQKEDHSDVQESGGGGKAVENARIMFVPSEC